MEMPQHLDDEAAYISENFGIPITTAVQISLESAKRKAKAKAKKRN